MSKYDLFGLTTFSSHTPCNTGICGLSFLYYVALSTMMQVRGFFQMLQKPTQPQSTKSSAKNTKILMFDSPRFKYDRGLLNNPQHRNE